MTDSLDRRQDLSDQMLEKTDVKGSSQRRAAGSIEEGDLGSLLGDLREGRWQADLYEMAREQLRQGGALREDPRTADWLYFLALNGSEDALVLGVDWGTVPVLLARACRKVWAIDVDSGRLSFLASRLKEQGITNVELLCAQGFGELPFKAASFDLMAAGDSVSGFDAEPFRTRLAVACGLLRDGGLLCLHVGNRLGFQRVLKPGAREEKRPWHTAYGYRRMLRKAGFVDIQGYAPLPYYNKLPLFYVPLGQRAALSFFLRNIFPLFEAVSPEVKSAHALEYAGARAAVRVASICRLEGLMRFFFSGFIFVSRKRDKGIRAT